MLKFVKPGLAGLLFVAAPAFADSPFDGAWKAQLQSAKIKAMPEVFTIKNGSYHCASCKPAPYSVPADGQFHAVAGKDYWDEVAVTVVDDHTVHYQFRKAGKIVSDNTNTVSADGMTLNGTSHNTNNGGNVPVDSTRTVKRIGKPVPGAHLTSGSWQPEPISSISDAALTWTMTVDGNRLHQVTGMGETLDATIGGDYALNQGDPGKTMTKVERPGPRALKFTDMRGGKIVGVSTYTVAADGKTLVGTWRDQDDGSTGQYTAMKM